jgi:uncharacterized membrane protein SpoIIM required for sporulation
MKETRFIAQNKEKWLESEKLLEEPAKDPEKLTNLFTQVIDDLSYSRTYYPNRSVRVYLNKIAREYFSIIYSHQKETKNRFRNFWLDELPQIVLFSKKQLIISLVIFLLAAAIGVFSSVKDPQFSSAILGESYVAMTKANIENGDPMAVYKKGHQMDMFLGITLNNLLVAFRTYVFGVFLSIGTIAILLYNGIMVGCFQFFFVERGLFAESALTIWLHGTLEISSIILAGGAGLTLGTGLVFPGTYSRIQAFQISAIRSLKLMLGITPVFVLAAVIESFLTRYTEVPDFLRLLLILLSASLILGYFVIYPWLKSRKGFDNPLTELRLPPSIDEPIHYDRIKNAAEIVKDSFVFYKKYANKILSPVAIITLVMTAAEFFLSEHRSSSRYLGEWWLNFLGDLFYALKTPEPIFIFINAGGTALIIYLVVGLLTNDFAIRRQKKYSWKSLIHIVLITGAVFAGLYALEGWGTFLLIFSFVIFLVYAFTQHIENTGLLRAFSRTWDVCMASFGQVMGMQIILLLMAFSFLMILSAPLIYLYNSIFQWNFARSDEWAIAIVRFIEIFIKLFAFNLIVPVLTASAALLYYSLVEILSADHLKRAIATVGSKDPKSSRR